MTPATRVDSPNLKIPAPAVRALLSVGHETLTDVAKSSESELLKLHGMGPKAVRLLRAAMSQVGLELKP